jgi:hypothetical protein
MTEEVLALMSRQPSLRTDFLSSSFSVMTAEISSGLSKL